MSVTLKRTMSDGDYGSYTVGVMMEEFVKPDEKRSAILDKLIQQEAAFIKAKLEELTGNLT